MEYCNWNVSKKKNKIDRLYDVFEYVKNGIQRDFTVLLNNWTRLTELEMRKKTIKIVLNRRNVIIITSHF